MTRLDFLKEVMLKVRLWENAEDTRLRTRNGRISKRSHLSSTDLHILLSAAEGSVARSDFSLGRLKQTSARREELVHTFERLQNLGYLDLSNSRYHITDTGMKFINAILV